jgi:hypothetical protein
VLDEIVSAYYCVCVTSACRLGKPRRSKAALADAAKKDDGHGPS